MDTITQKDTEQSPEDFLGSALHALPGMDVTDYRPDLSEENTTEKIDTQDRGTADPDESKLESKDSIDTSNTDASTAKTNEQVNVPKNRSNNRIQELIAQVKERDARIAEFEKAKSNQSLQSPTIAEPPKQQEIPAMIPKPEYDVKSLEGLKTKYEDALEEHRINGDLVKIKETREFLRLIDIKLDEARTWEARNKAQVDQHNSYLNHYRNEIMNKWPEMKDEKSPIRQEYAKVHSRFMELQKNPALLEYELTSLASLRLNAAKASALEEQVKKLQQENAALKEKRKPLSQVEAPSTGGVTDNSNPDDELLAGLKGLSRFR